MIPPVPYALRMPLALACVSTAILIRVLAGRVADVFRALGEWIVPEMQELR